MLFTEDIWQTLSVVHAANCSQIVSAYIRRFWIYSLFKCLHLKDNRRLQSLRKNAHATPDALQFPGYLLQLGEGNLQLERQEPIQLPAFVEISRVANEMRKAVFTNLRSFLSNKEYIAQRAILTTQSGVFKNTMRA